MDTEKNLDGLLEDTIRDSIEKYSQCEAGSKESAILCDSITKLCHSKLEFERAQADIDEKSEKILIEKEKNKKDDECQKAKSEREKKEFLIGTVVKVGIAIGTIAFAIWQNTSGIMYEQNGIWKSPTVKDIIRQTKPRIKMDV